MNIFILHENPTKAAQMLCDKHVVKMTLETAQILCSVLHKHNISAPYRPTHKNHPCVLWTGESEENFLWTVEHGLALGEEYTFRYGKQHKSVSVIEEAFCQADNVSFPQVERTPFVLCLPDQYKTVSAVESYRTYYREDKKEFARWTKRQQPEWWF